MMLCVLMCSCNWVNMTLSSILLSAGNKFTGLYDAQSVEFRCGGFSNGVTFDVLSVEGNCCEVMVPLTILYL